MNERSIFLEALDQADPTQRSAYLDKACAGDAALRQHVEALLKTHSAAGGFLDRLAPERVAEELGRQPGGEETQGASPGNDKAGEDLGFLTPADKPDVLGRLGHYDILEVIGRGGMGVVLRAFDEKLHRVVAIKVMAAQLATNATARKRFQREAQAAAAVSHDHLVTIHAVEETNGLPYIAMQYVAGLSLQQRLERDGPLQLQEILRIGMQTASGLAAAHAQGLVHRDVKPANILLENGVERVKITDFGLARAATEASLTQSGVVAGTPQYMSPEQAEGKVIDQRTDLFSLGSVLYAMCTGRAPFRASGTVAVLKRVCEKTPTPIRETNPDVPDWFVAIIAKLHAKDPAQRYQSAAEVAELLGRHLAHVQHPSVVPLLPAAPRSGAGGEELSPAQPRRRRLAVAAAVFLCFLVGLSLTEATGVTNVRGTVIRIFTPDGTLVVDINDPGVKVTIEGDGGLVITGAGLEEIRLRPGSYKVHADRDGKPVALDRELVSIAKGGREIVKVKMEAPAAPMAAKGEKGAFVLLAAGKERKFDTLAEAVQGANDGDTIEVRGNGPFVTDHIRFRHALAVRAGVGFRPVLTAVPGNEFPWGRLLVSFAPLRLEGLEVHGDSKAYLILDAQGPLWVANCRFLVAHPEAGVCITSCSACVIQNCEMVSAGAALDFRCDSDATSIVTNNLLIGQVNLWEHDHTKGATFQFTGNTHVSAVCNAFLHGTLNRQARTTDPLEKRVHLSVTNNVITCGSGPYGFSQHHTARPHLSGKDAELWVQRRLDWRDENNSYQVERGQWIQINSDGVVHTTSHKTLADWNTFWGLKTTGSSEGEFRFLGGDLISRSLTHPLKLIPEDVRLRSDSAGYRARKDGKDLGADVDLVGPGPAYERWKKTPAYQQWLKESGQVKK
jgi:hypothetical protein